MFVKAAYRGREHAAAVTLLRTLLASAKTASLEEVFLGTTEKFLAAHRFYEKHGFDQVSPGDLPAAFPRMARYAVLQAGSLLTAGTCRACAQDPIPSAADEALAAKFRQAGAYTDCYTTEGAAHVSHVRFIEAFYLLGFHKLYSRVLLSSARKRLTELTRTG